MVQGCRRDESFPGLWEVPVWRLSNETGVGNATYAMDVAWSYDCDMDGEDDEGCMCAGPRGPPPARPQPRLRMRRLRAQHSPEPPQLLNFSTSQTQLCAATTRAPCLTS